MVCVRCAGIELYGTLADSMIIVLQAPSVDNNFHKPDDVYMGFLPFYHIYGINSLILSVCGHRAQLLVVMPKYTLENFLKAIEKYKVTFANIVPPVGKYIWWI